MSKSVSFVVIGDPHIKIENLKEFDQFIDKLVNLIFEKLIRLFLKF